MNPENNAEIEKLSRDFEKCRDIFIALGDENRQHLILEMMKMGKCSGVRVGEITEKSNLSRPAVSHHLQILKSAEIVKCKRVGTKNFYSFDEKSNALDDILCVISEAKNVMKNISENRR